MLHASRCTYLLFIQCKCKSSLLLLIHLGYFCIRRSANKENPAALPFADFFSRRYLLLGSLSLCLFFKPRAPQIPSSCSSSTNALSSSPAPQRPAERPSGARPDVSLRFPAGRALLGSVGFLLSALELPWPELPARSLSAHRARPEFLVARSFSALLSLFPGASSLLPVPSSMAVAAFPWSSPAPSLPVDEHDALLHLPLHVGAALSCSPWALPVVSLSRSSSPPPSTALAQLCWPRPCSCVQLPRSLLLAMAGSLLRSLRSPLSSSIAESSPCC